MQKFVFATNNAHKLSELRQIAGDEFEIVSLSDIGFTAEIDETGATLEANALIKARAIRAFCGLDVIADDTGLEVRALGGAPGVHSARYATDGHDSAANMALLLHNLEGKDDRRAQFRTVICLIDSTGEHLFEGIVKGEILTAPVGEGGFGYDPVFRPIGYDDTFASMPPEAKNAISHRGRATSALIAYLADKQCKI